jgi:hypothetical protein
MPPAAQLGCEDEEALRPPAGGAGDGAAVCAASSCRTDWGVAGSQRLLGDDPPFRDDSPPSPSGEMGSGTG